MIWLVVCSSCATSPEAPLSMATFSGSDMVHSSRAQAGFVSYGAPYHKWTITVATLEGCGGDTQAEVEINTLSGIIDLPTGVIPVRTTETMITALPSAYVRYQGAPVISGSVTIDSASPSYVAGSWTAQVMLGGIPTELTATFGAPVCPSS